MHLVLGVPLRVSTATSNMMIGITATSSAVIYLLRDEIDPFVAGPTAAGRVPGRVGRVADRPSRRCPAPALAVRAHARVHRDRDGRARRSGCERRHAGRRLDAAAIETLIARLLVVGTYLAMGLVLLGVVGMLLTGVDPLDHGSPPVFDLARIPADLFALRPEGFLWLGIGLVIALPVGRVIVAGVGFLAARDRRLALVSLAVLLVVTASIVAAISLEG